jgi:HAD superfamily hydrolase (TIGR01509 family)
MEFAFPPPGHFAGYIFDLDGTLAASMQLHYRAWKQALADHGATIDFNWELFISCAGMGTEQFITRLNTHHGEKLNAAQVARTQDAVLTQIHHTVEPVPEVFAFARQLAADAKPIAIASGGTRAAVNRTLHYINASHLFKVVVTIDDVIHGKPAPDTFLQAAKLLSVMPEECVVLGDSVLDIEAAKAAKMAWVKLEPK